MMLKRWLAIMMLLVPAAGIATEPSPYVGQQQRTIKSLSPEEVEALRSGQGMGFALPAELNAYPGPRHVLELADQLALTRDQRLATEALFAAMRRDAIALGEELIAAEAALDERFANRLIDAESLEQALLAIGRIRAQLRFVHLEAHLQQRHLLTAEQIERYVSLRGYDQTDHDRHRRRTDH